jgi:hypothetical protein
MLASLFTVGLAGYAASFLLRYDSGFSTQALMLGAILLLLLSYRSFLRATVTIDDAGLRQTGLLGKEVRWDDVRGAKLIGLPRAGWLSPPRLVVRTGTAFYTFNGGTQEVLTEFARISLAYELKK